MLKASVIGNLGNDPEMKYSANGAPFLRFNVASNGRVRTQDGGWEDRTEWVRVTVFGQRAESLSQHLRKGMRVYVDGRLEARPWTDQQGGLRAGLELVAGDVEFLSSRQDDEDAQQPSREQRPAASQSASRRTPGPADGARRPNAMPESTAVHGGRQPARGRAAVADREDDGGDLDDLPF